MLRKGLGTITMHPNLNIPLYFVAPDERRGKVSSEVNRLTFSRRTPPLNRICNYISFSALRQNMERVRRYDPLSKTGVLAGVGRALRAG
jgi:hypothetical protein